MNIFKRLYTIGKAEINSVLENFEDPIKLTENGISDMKNQLSESMEALAKLKALSIRKKNEIESEEQTAKDYYTKAILLVQKSDKGEIEVSEADRLAKEALKKQSIAQESVENLKKENEKLQDDCEKMQANINNLKSSISKWENELRTLEARVQVSEATKDINQKMTQIDSSSAVSMLEKLKEKVVQQEAMAEAYSDISKAGKSVDEEIDDLVKNIDGEAENALQKLKESLKKG
ncbi:phage shock protein A [Chryseobacterium aquaticum]|uniref:Phage shock protein A n=1 Tax=Chryseobacterium aquaticum TaxID=452084 RepID=A0A0Q3HNQ2_9FLAO|nr:PspA/IM30 family protein [Chryseobacterium aquaticum]KQK24408.1 phage shock protein A [Chryseobacterium aquaticum]